jgi:serine/threonine-protein kinase
MGRVYEARHTRLFSKRFAVKVLHGDLTRQAEVVGRFLREAEATSALQHPNIVGVIDVSQLTDGRPFIVAELLEGEQLGDYLEKHGKLSVAEAVSLCRPICQALAAAHEKEIVHRDIKPENLFVIGDGCNRTVKVLDFGISLVGDAAASLTKTGMVMGTPAYMPPEQARGRRVDHRADIYAVGAILYETLTGKPPFERTDPISTLGAVLTRAPAAPTSLAPEIPAGLERVVQKAMEKLPERRYASMLELDAALAEFDARLSRSVPLPAVERQSVVPPGAADALPADWRTRLLQYYQGPQHARARLWAVSVVGATALFAMLVALSFGLMRAVFGTEQPLSTGQWFAGLLGCAGVLGIGAMTWAHHLFWHVWPSSTRVNQTLERSARALAASASMYALSMLLMRAVTSLAGSPEAAAWVGWDALSLLLSSATAGLTLWLFKPESR